MDGRYRSGTPSLLRAMNERTVFDLVLDMGPISTAQVARLCGMSKPTAAQALAGLERKRLLRQAGRTSGGRGPAARLYEIDPAAGWVVAVDVGRSFVRSAIADLTGDIRGRRDERSRVRSSAALVGQIGELARGVATDLRVRWSKVVYSVVGSPGIVEPALDHVALAHNLPGWGRPGLLGAISRELGRHVEVENDVNLAALGEQRLGAGKDVPNFLFLQVGAGVGMGMVLDGELFRGATGAAGEVGYLPLGQQDPHDPSSRRYGALERDLAAGGVVRLARKLGMTGPLDGRRVFAAARRGDPVARRVVEIEAERIALAVAAVVPVADPELVILGGAIGRNGDLLLEPVRRELRALSPFHPRLEVSSLGEDAVLHGAIAVALEAARDRLLGLDGLHPHVRRRSRRRGAGRLDRAGTSARRT